MMLQFKQCIAEGANTLLLRQFKQAQPTLLLAILLGALGAVATIMQMALLSRIVSRVFLIHADLAQVELLLFLLFGTIVVRAGSLWGREIAAQRGAIRVKSHLRERLFAHLLRLGPAYSRHERTGELVTTVSEGIETLDAYISRYIPQMALSVLVPLLILCVLFPLDWSSALLLFVTGPIIPLLMVLVGTYAEKHMQHQWLTLARISAYFLDSVQGLTTLKLFGRTAQEHERIAHFSDLFRERTMKTLRVAFLSGMVLEFLSAAAIGLVAVTLGIRLLNGNVTFEQALFVLLLAPEFYRPLRELGVQRHAALEGKVATKRIYEILDTPLPVQTGSISTPSVAVPARQCTIELTNVAYTYPGQSQPALKGASLTLAAGSCTALIGRSGAGKSTLVNLLLRFLEAQDGTITVNGMALTDLAVETWREYVALVPQRPYLFYGSVRENIRFARPTASEQEVERAAQLAGVTEFMQQLPQGYDTQIGEQGMRLSAGQAQRLALARAFLKDAPVLILDEPTSSLDPISESYIKDALLRLTENRTVLVIAHRYNTIQAVDHIAIMEDGRIVEVGRREELLQHSRVYAHLMAGHPLIGANTVYPLPATSAAPAPTESGDIRHEQSGGIGYVQRDVPVMPSLVFGRLLRLLVAFRWQVALAILLGCATVASNIGLLSMAAYLIAAAALGPLLVTLSIPIAIVRFMGVSRATARYAERLLSHNVTFRLLARLRVVVYQRLEPLAPGHLLRYRSGDILSRLVSDVDELQNIYLRVVSPIVVAVLIAALTFVVFALFNLGLAWVALTFLVVAGLGVPALTSALARRLGKRQVAVRATLRAGIVDGVQGVQDILACGQVQDQQQKIAHLTMVLGQIQRRMAMISGLQQSLNDFLMNAALLTILVLAIPLIMTKAIGGVYLAFLTLLILASFEAVQPLGQAFQFLGHSLAAAKRLFEIIDAPPAVVEPTSPLPIINTSGHELVFEHVHFRYAAGEDEVLHDISFRVRAGSRVALVGASGSGKSTLIGLALRFWDPASGTVCLDGQDMRDYALGDIHTLMSVVTQDTYLFNNTIRGNLRIAKPDASDAEIMQALEQAQLTPLIARLPEGLGTWIGEQGLQLSGGERQRLAIARALLKNAPILLLDEATAHLDPLTEGALLAALDVLMQGRTTLLATHRLLAMEKMDQILVLDGGCIKEYGTHEELLKAEGIYKQLFDVQRGILTLI